MSTRQNDSHTLLSANGVEATIAFDGTNVTIAIGGTTYLTVGGTGAQLTAGGLRDRINASVAAAGSIQSDAAPVLEGFTVVTAADGTKGVLLPVAVAGMIVKIKNTAAAVLKIWPTGSAIINALSASAAYSLTTGAIPITLEATSATQWYTMPLVGS